MSKQDYWDTGLQRAVMSLRGIPNKHWGDADYVRRWINAAERDVLLLTTVADFWLMLDKEEGQRRRSFKVPANPFTVSGTYGSQAPRYRVEQWQSEWIQRKGVEAELKAVEDKVDTVSVSHAALLRKKHPWLVASEERYEKRRYKRSVVAFVGHLPQKLLGHAYRDASTMDLEWLTLAQAIHRPWFERDERAYWLAAFGSFQALAVEEMRARFDLEHARLRRAVLRDLAAVRGVNESGKSRL